MLLFSDLHLKPETASICIPVLYRLLEEAERLKESTIAFLGDFWHLRYSVPVSLVNAVSEWLYEARSRSLRVVFLPGNHDQVDELGSNALAVFASHAHVDVYSSPTCDKFGMWLPYRKPEHVPDALQALRAQRSDATPNVLFAHLPILGALMNNLRRDDTGLDPKVFGPLDAGFFGHYHKQQSFGGLHYVGSPWQTRADEYGQPKGFATWSGGVFTRHDRVWGPRFHRFDVSTSVDALRAAYDAGQVGVDDAVSVVGPVSRREETLALLPEDVTVSWRDSEEELATPRLALAEHSSLDEYVAAYVDQEKASGADESLWAIYAEIQREAAE